MKLPSLRLVQNGDSIVEVLITLTIITMVLTGAFLVSQRSVSVVQDGQEHTEVLGFMQGQLESVRSMASKTTSTSEGVFAGSGYFCIDDSTPDNPVRKNVMSNLPPLASDNFSGYGTCTFGPDGRYKIVGNYDNGLFTFYGRWDGLTKNKQEEILRYRVYPATPVARASVFLADDPDADDTLVAVVDGIRGRPCWSRGDTGGWNDPDCWHVTVQNLSANPPGIVETCSVNWGDGTVETFPTADASCQKGAKLGHYYKVLPRPPDDKQYSYYVTIKNTAVDGRFKISDPQPEGVPY